LWITEGGSGKFPAEDSGIFNMKAISSSVRETLDLGRKLAGKLKKGDIVCLFGEFGSGKTVFTKGIAWGLGVRRHEITSPSFVLIREYYSGRIPLFHFDLYRLKGEKEIATIGYEEYFYSDGITVIEWADRLKRLLPDKFLGVSIEITGDKTRKISICQT